MGVITRRRWGAITATALLCLTAAAASAPGLARAETAQAYDSATSYEVVIGAGKSQVLQLPTPYTDVMVADPKVADVLPLNAHSVYVVGKTIGATAITIYGPGKRLIAAINVEVSADVDGFKGRLHEILPDEKAIAARAANDSIVLSGQASSPVVLQQIVTLAGTYAPGKVVNMMTVEGAQQVMLSVRFVEMERTTAKNLGLNVQGFQPGHAPAPGTVASPTNGFSFTTGNSFANLAELFTPFGGAAALLRTKNFDLNFLMDALETKGAVKTLAEPNLTAMSGDTANFLAGGEFPIPVAESGAGTGQPTITIDFKQFGVGLAFTPTILKDGLINLVVNPEVSEIDRTIEVNSGGVSVPGLKVRRAHTTIELRDGESFTIAGLLKENYANSINQYPFIGDIPVLGALFRSSSFQRDETELVIVVTPHLVTPRRGPTATPADDFIPPSDFELFLMGATKGSAASLSPEDRALMSSDPEQGGIDGPHGHVLF